MLSVLWKLTLQAGPFGLAAICLGILAIPWVISRGPLAPVAVQLSIGAIGCIAARGTALHAALRSDPEQRAAALAHALGVATALPIVVSTCAIGLLIPLLFTHVGHVGASRGRWRMLAWWALGVGVPIAGGLWLQHGAPLVVGVVALISGARTAQIMTRCPPDGAAGQLRVTTGHVLAVGLASVGPLALSQVKGSLCTTALTLEQKQAQRVYELLDLQDVTILLFATVAIAGVPAAIASARTTDSAPLLLPLLALFAWAADPSTSVALRMALP